MTYEKPIIMKYNADDIREFEALAGSNSCSGNTGCVGKTTCVCVTFQCVWKR